MLIEGEAAASLSVGGLLRWLLVGLYKYATGTSKGWLSNLWSLVGSLL